MFLELTGFILPWLFAPTLVLLPMVLLRGGSHRQIAIAAAPVLIFAALYSRFYLPNGPMPSEAETFKVMTYNIHYLNHNFQEIAAEIQRHQPDIVGIHELLTHSAEPFSQQLEKQYPYQMINSTIGLFSRYPLLDCEAFRMGYGEGYYAQRCAVELEGQTLIVFNVHPRSPYLPGEETEHLPFGQLQSQDLQDLLERIDHENGSLLLIGDFNMSDQQSVYSQLTARLRDAHVDSGWGQGFTFTGSPKSNLAIWRIDYIFYTPDLLSIKTETGKSGNSDHRPLISTLTVR